MDHDSGIIEFISDATTIDSLKQNLINLKIEPTLKNFFCNLFIKTSITMYFHMDSLANINVGEKINQGNPVGTLGETGYASGYHLHWELRVNNIPVDPMQWINPTF